MPQVRHKQTHLPIRDAQDEEDIKEMRHNTHILLPSELLL